MPLQLAGRGRGTGNDAQRDGVTRTPDAHALPLLDHPHELPPLGMAQRLNDLEDHRVSERCVGDIQTTLRHDALGQFPRRQFGIHPKVTDADIGDLALLKKPWLTMYQARWRSGAANSSIVAFT